MLGQIAAHAGPAALRLRRGDVGRYDPHPFVLSAGPQLGRSSVADFNTEAGLRLVIGAVCGAS